MIWEARVEMEIVRNASSNPERSMFVHSMVSLWVSSNNGSRPLRNSASEYSRY